MGVISLEGLEFFSYHGFYDEEQKIGNRYSVDISVTTDFSEAARLDRLQFTIDYEQLYRIVAEEMAQKARLLEHIADRIIDRTYQVYPYIDSVEVSVSKLNPPIGGVSTRARVTLKR